MRAHDRNALVWLALAWLLLGRSKGSSSPMPPALVATSPAVLARWIPVQSEWEGSVSYLYPDALGFLTTGMGNLVDSDARGPDGRHAAGSLTAYGPAIALPWTHADGSIASTGEVIAEWQRIKRAYPGVQSTAAEKIATLRLQPKTVEALILRQLAVNEASLLEGFPSFRAFPADAQMAIHGMAWAMGGAFWKKFPRFTAAANAAEWAAAKAESAFTDEAPARKLGHDRMFDNAAAVVAQGLNPSTLYYPSSAAVA